MLKYAILYFLSPYIADFFSQPVLCDIVRILSLSLIINALSIVQKVILIRKLDFKTQAFISLASSLTSGSVGVIMALGGYGVWALVVMQILRLGINTLLLWVCSKWFPTLSFSVASFKEMFSFGGRLLITSIISVIWNEIYSFIIGKSYSAAILGQYSRAEKFKSMVTSNISIVMQRVTYPVLSSIREDKERQLRVFRKLFRTTVLISFTAVLGLAAASESIVITLVGEKWIPSIEYLQILCFSGLFIPIQITAANIINANGRSDITLRLEIIKTALAVIPVIAGIFISVEALLYGMIVVSVISFVIHSHYVNKVIDYKITEQIKDIIPFFAVALCVSFVVYLFSNIALPYWCIMFVQLFVGFLLTVIAYEYIYKSQEYEDIKNSVFNCKSIDYYVGGICCFSPFLSQINAYKPSKEIKSIVVAAGFPHSQIPLSVKKEEIRYAIENNVDEVDICLNRGLFFEESREKAFQEISEIRDLLNLVNKKIVLKVILEVGELRTYSNIYSAAKVALESGADFIKTSTGKSQKGADVYSVCVMLLVLREFYKASGELRGLKVAGGVSRSEDALRYRNLFEAFCGKIDGNQYFRIGCSGLFENMKDDINET